MGSLSHSDGSNSKRKKKVLWRGRKKDRTEKKKVTESKKRKEKRFVIHPGQSRSEQREKVIIRRGKGLGEAKRGSVPGRRIRQCGGSPPAKIFWKKRGGVGEGWLAS